MHNRRNPFQYGFSECFKSCSPICYINVRLPNPSRQSPSQELRASLFNQLTTVLYNANGMGSCHWSVNIDFFVLPLPPCLFLCSAQYLGNAFYSLFCNTKTQYSLLAAVREPAIIPLLLTRVKPCRKLLDYVNENKLTRCSHGGLHFLKILTKTDFLLFPLMLNDSFFSPGDISQPRECSTGPVSGLCMTVINCKAQILLDVNLVI